MIAKKMFLKNLSIFFRSPAYISAMIKSQRREDKNFQKKKLNNIFFEQKNFNVNLNLTKIEQNSTVGFHTPMYNLSPVISIKLKVII